jgi:3-dehydroquinate synthetase
VYRLHGEQMRAYFAHHGIDLTAFGVAIGETGKTLRTVERIVDAFGEFGLVRSEPVLVVGGGLTTDVAGFACAIFRRSTTYNRVPTTLIGLIDASVAIKVAVNHGRSKNRLGAFHASQNVILDFSFLKTLPPKEVRNGMAELIKISAVANVGIFELLEKYGPDLLATRFGHLDGTPELRDIAHRVTYDAIHTMLRLEVPTCTRPTWTGRLPSAIPGVPCWSWRPGSRSSTATRSASTWRSRPPSPSSAATSRSASATGSSG